MLFLLHHKNPSLQFRIVGSFEKALSLLGIPTICSNRARSMRGAMVPATRGVLVRRLERCSSGHDKTDVAMLLFNFFDRSVSIAVRAGLHDKRRVIRSVVWNSSPIHTSIACHVSCCESLGPGRMATAQLQAKRNVGLQKRFAGRLDDVAFEFVRRRSKHAFCRAQ